MSEGNFLMMKREVRDRWVAALRSGDYSQGTGYLCDGENNFCCLGVFNDVMNNKVEFYGATREYREYFNYSETDDPDDDIYSPVHNFEWLESQGLDYTNAATLATMNDDGSSFYELADWIEENVEVID